MEQRFVKISERQAVAITAIVSVTVVEGSVVLSLTDGTHPTVEDKYVSTFLTALDVKF